MYKSSNISLFLNAANLQNLLSKRADYTNSKLIEDFIYRPGSGRMRELTADALSGSTANVETTGDLSIPLNSSLPLNSTITTRHPAKSPLIDYINQPGAAPVSKLTPDALAGRTGNFESVYDSLLPIPDQTTQQLRNELNRNFAHRLKRIMQRQDAYEMAYRRYVPMPGRSYY